MPTDRHDRLIQQHRQDPYRPRQSPPEPAACPDCRAVWRGGRWQWAEPPSDATPLVCPACQRTRDHHPAGMVTLEGTFVTRHAEELLNLVRNTADLEKRERPLNRIMDIESTLDRILVTTTDSHLPRRIGTAVQSAYDGVLSPPGGDGEALARVTWRRDD